MKVTKIFKTESAHIVRNCSSQRCSHSIHGHSAVIEVEMKSDTLDNAQMVYDFGLMSSFKQFIDSLDHCYLLCKHDDEEFKEFIKKSCDRWIELPFNPSAEMLSLFIMAGCRHILKNTRKANGEDNDLCVSGVTYHETATGRATCDRNDLSKIWDSEYDINDVKFSDGITKEWNTPLYECMLDNNIIINPTIKKQINL